MDECCKCGISEERVKLFDAIGNESIVKICQRCSVNERIPIINRPTDFQMQKAEKHFSIYERLSNAAGINSKTHTPTPLGNLSNSRDKELKQVVNQNFKKTEEVVKKQIRPDLIENFHWVIMRARRAKKVTQEQLARELAESEEAIKLAEKGVLPENDYALINKLENFLGINLLAKEAVEMVQKEKKLEVAFDKVSSKSLTIADLREMKKKKEDEIFERDIDGEYGERRLKELENQIIQEEDIDENPTPSENKPEFVSGNVEKVLKDKKELTQDEIKDLIFRNR